MVLSARFREGMKAGAGTLWRMQGCALEGALKMAGGGNVHLQLRVLVCLQLLSSIPYPLSFICYSRNLI